MHPARAHLVAFRVGLPGLVSLVSAVSLVSPLGGCSSSSSGGASGDDGGGGASSGGSGSGGSGSGSSSGSNGSSGSSGSSTGSSSGAASSGSSSGMVYTCMGCIDTSGRCQPGTADNKCGLGNSFCVDCTGLSATPACGAAGECAATHTAGDAGPGPVEAGSDGATPPADSGGG